MSSSPVSRQSEVLAQQVVFRVRGASLSVEVLEGERAVRDVAVRGIAVEYSGANASRDRRALHRLMREADTLSGAFSAMDSRALWNFVRKRKTLELPGI